MKQIKATAVVLVLLIAGVAFAQQAQDGSKKPAAKKSECSSKMKSNTRGKMACCASDSTGTKDGKSCCGNH